MKFILYKDNVGEYRWRLKSGNGNIIATSSEGYTTKDNCKNGIRLVQDGAPGAPIEDLT